MMKEGSTKLYNWAIQKAGSNRAPLWLALIFSLELFLFIPLDAVLIFFCLQNRRNILLYIAITSIASAFSGLIGYLMGYFLWDLIGSYVVPHLISISLFERLSTHFQLYENWAVFIASFLPFPLKALSLTAGVFHIGFISYLSSLFLARFVRFSLVGGAMAIWGESVKSFIDKHFHRIFMAVAAKIAAAFLFFWALAR